MPLHLWLIDDKPANIAMIEASFPPDVLAVIRIRSFLRAADAMVAFESALAHDRASLPDFILLDYFLDGVYGHELLDRMLERYAATDTPRGVIVAHSSMAEASQLLEQHGADCTLPKVKGLPRSEAVAWAFRSVAAVEWFREHRRPLAGR